MAQDGDTLRCFTISQEAKLLSDVLSLRDCESAVDSLVADIETCNQVVEVCLEQKDQLREKEEHYDQIITAKTLQNEALLKENKRYSRKIKRKKIFGTIKTGILAGVIVFLLIR